jgi:hypothetical protein
MGSSSKAGWMQSLCVACGVTLCDISMTTLYSRDNLIHKNNRVKVSQRISSMPEYKFYLHSR